MYRDTVSARETRATDAGQLQLPRVSTEHARKIFHFRAVAQWNNAPAAVRETGTAAKCCRAARQWLTRALLGLWIFHRLLGGGAFERPPMISAPGRHIEKQKAAFESSRKIISKSFRSFFGSGQNWSLQGSKFQNFPKRFFDTKIFNFKDRATNLTPSCLSR